MRPTNAFRQGGFTVVELLISAAIVVMVLAMAGIFLAQQSQLQRSTQNRSELQDRVRVGLQLMTQDLALTGNSAVIALDGARQDISWPGCFDGAAGCLQVSGGGTAMKVRYLSSQFEAGSECRDVSYRLIDGTLERSDVTCASADSFVELADNVIDFQVSVHCSNGTDLDVFPSGSCPPISSYGRSVSVEMTGRSRAATSGPAVSGCPTGFQCFSMKQETLMPNMKDQ